MSISLTGRQQQFVECYVQDRNATRAAIRAGYGRAGARTTSYHLLRNPAVHHAIELRYQQIREQCDIDRLDVLSGLWGAFEAAKERSNSRDMVSALREVAKILGLYHHGDSSKRQEPITPTTAEQWQRVPTDQLIAYLQQLHQTGIAPACLELSS